MALILRTNLKVSDLPKEKLYEGTKGTYLPVTIVVNDYLNEFDKQGPVFVEQTKEEREAREPKTYLGDVNVVYNDLGEIRSSKELKTNE